MELLLLVLLLPLALALLNTPPQDTPPIVIIQQPAPNLGCLPVLLLALLAVLALLLLG
jgi:hypothetical protein